MAHMNHRCSLALHKKVLQYSPSIEQGRSPIPHHMICLDPVLDPLKKVSSAYLGYIDFGDKSMLVTICWCW